MLQKACNLCGIIIYGDKEMCETCVLLMPVTHANNEPVKSNINHFPTVENNLAFNSETSFQKPFEQNFNTNQAFNPANQTFNPAVNQTATAGFQPNYQATPTIPRRNNPRQPAIPQPLKKEYKPSVWDWIMDLPMFVKVGLGVLLLSIVFGFALRTFMGLDVSVQNVESTASLEPQKPWFSSWFRSKPTAEEIFEKYESITLAKGRNLSAQSFVISGKLTVLSKSPTSTVDLLAVKKAQNNPDDKSQPPAVASPNNTSSQVVTSSNPVDMDITYQAAVKNPNKFLMKMSMKPKPSFDQSVSVISNSGSDGVSPSWGFTRTFIKTYNTVIEEKNKNCNIYFARTADGISMTFQRSMYSKIELVGEEVIFNRKNYRVKAFNANGEESNIFFDEETGLAAKIAQKNLEMYILDYRNFEGTMFPSKMIYLADSLWYLSEMQKLESNIPLEDSVFLRATY